MINKSQFESLENESDVYAKRKQLNSDLTKQYINDYFRLLLLFFKQVNEIESIDLIHLDRYPVVPMNFLKQCQHVLKRKYHFMGRSQIKTLKSELTKMNVSCQIRRKNQNNN